MTTTDTDTIFNLPADRVTMLAGTPERFARVALSIVAEPGDRQMADLLRENSAETVLNALINDDPAALNLLLLITGVFDPDGETRRRWKARLSAPAALKALDDAVRLDAVLVIPGEPEWPTQMDDLECPPIALWVRGDVELLANPNQVSIIGARAATGYGEHVAMEMAAGLVARDVVVVSGGAYGIDGMAHRAALASGGKTIAYMAGGIDRLYPSGHEALLTRVAQQGAIVSELPPGAAPTRWRFLARNRLIAASSAATLVIEAGRRSGSLNAAGHATTLGRPLGAVPGPITSAASAGTHHLIQEGATCITSVAEAFSLAFPEPITPEED